MDILSVMNPNFNRTLAGIGAFASLINEKKNGNSGAFLNRILKRKRNNKVAKASRKANRK